MNVFKMLEELRFTGYIDMTYAANAGFRLVEKRHDDASINEKARLSTQGDEGSSSELEPCAVRQ